MDVSLLPTACRHGAQVLSSTRVERVVCEQGRAIGVRGRTDGGAALRLTARQAVVLAASAVQSPALLLASGLRHGPVGEHFQCHPGVSVAGRFAEPVRLWTGATQGHEVVGLRREGIKFEALGYDLSVAAMRLKSTGQRFRDELATLGQWCQWGAAIRARGRGRVRPGRRRPQLRFRLEREDAQRLRRGVRVLGEMLLAAGAEVVTPGVHGWHERVADRASMARFEQEGPLDPQAYTMAVTHMFGTCRMGSDPRTSVVRPDFRHHAVDGLYVADSSVFPTNIGVNPQTSIIALARLCARRVIAGSTPR
jgi:choline dehydrogenase-like flavoprotein